MCGAALLVEKSSFHATAEVPRSLPCTLSPMETTYHATESIRGYQWFFITVEVKFSWQTTIQ